jgi:hypothetical protein
MSSASSLMDTDKLSNTLIQQPIFLVGAERSGTTVCRLMLDHHPSITWCNEFEYAVDKMPPDAGWPDLDEYYEWLSTHRIFQATNFEIDQSLSYPELVNSFLVQRLETRKKTIVGATVHHHFDRLLRIWPDAKFLHIVRDPRDVARSCIGMGWAGNVWHGAKRWIEAEQIWEKFSDQLSEDQKIEFTYTNLITHNKETLTRICNFIGVDYDDRMLTYPDYTDYSLPDEKLVSQWPTKLSEREIQWVEARVDDLLVQKGFEYSGLPIKPPSVIEQKRLALQNWLYRVNHRIKIHGLSLSLSEFISRKLHLKTWNRSCRLKMNAIMQSRLKKSLT